MSEPTVITFDETNTLQILIKYIEIAQSKGAFLLAEAEVLKRAIDVLVNNVNDPDLDQINSKRLLIQGVQKGQNHGAYTLNDASLLSKTIQYIISKQPEIQTPQPVQEEQVVPVSIEDEDDFDLSGAIPLKPRIN